MAADPDSRGPGMALTAFGVAVVIGHHLGTLLKPLGTVGSTEWADWVDLLVPLAVLGSAAAVLAAARATRREWLLYAAGALVYAQGHGVHLAANSVSNAEPTGRARDAAHLWDEAVGHYIWYAGLAVVVLSLVLALLRARRPAYVGAFGYLLAGLFGFTWMTNAIEGGTVPLSAAVAAALVVLAARRRSAPVARLVLVAYGLSLAMIASWGVWQGGFPQFSELGWI